MKRFLTILLFVLSLFGAKAQTSVFSKVIYDTLEWNYGISTSSFIPAYGNAYLLAGRSDSSGLAIKIDTGGSVIWNKKYALTGSTIFYNVISTIDSCFLLSGSITDKATGRNSLFVKINGNGDTLWSKKIKHNIASGEAYNVQQTFDSGYIVTGRAGGRINGPAYRLLVMKLDYSGKLEWAKVFEKNVPNKIIGYSIKQGPDSNYTIIGSTDYGLFLMKLSLTGSVIWSKEYSTFSNLSIGNDFLFIGNEYLCYYYNGGLALMTTDFSGNVIWNKVIPFTQGMGHNIFDPALPKLHKTSDSGYVFTTSDCFYGSTMYKVDSARNVIWSKRIELMPSDIFETKDKGYFVAGNGRMCGYKNESYLQIGVIKTDSLGNGTNCFYSSKDTSKVDKIVPADFISVDTSGGTMFSVHPLISSLKLYTRYGCVERSSGVNELKFENTIKIYPNPSNGIFTFESKEIKQYQISIYNILGETIYRSSFTGIGHQIDLTSESNGMYYYRIESSDKNFASGKLLKIE